MLINTKWSEVYLPNKAESVVEMTKRYLDDIESRNLLIPKNKVLYKREKIPKDLSQIKDPDEQRLFVKDVLTKWKYGDGQLSPAMYAYHNLVRIHNRSKGGFVAPVFRNYDMHEFDLWRAAAHGTGVFYHDIRHKDIMSLGARGKGKSAKIGVNAITEAVFSNNMNQFLFSKDETTIKDFLREKVNLPYGTIAEYLRPKYNSTLMTFGIGKDTDTRSYIMGKVPVVEKAEGGGAKIVYYDEAPKTRNLLQIKDMTDGCLLGEDGFTKEGTSIFTGVAGDFGKFGTDYIDMWSNPDSYNVVRWFIPAWVGMACDQYGNEDIEAAVYDILIKRYHVAKSKNENALLNELQKHPLSPDEALQTPTNSFINTTKVTIQYKRISEDSMGYIRQGRFEWNADKSGAIFRDLRSDVKEEPKISLIELPPVKKGRGITGDYVMYVDCYDVKDKPSEGSSGACYVYKMPVEMSAGKLEACIEEFNHAQTNEEKVQALLKMGGLPVLEYVDMPDITEFNDNIAKIFTAYNCMAMVEKLPSQTFVSLYKDYKEHLQYKPRKVGDGKLKRTDLKERGIKVDDYWKSERNRCIKWYVDNHYDRIYFPRLLKDMMTYDPDIDRKKHDSVDAFGGVIIHSQQEELLKLLKQQIVDDYAQDLFFGIKSIDGVLQVGR